MSAPAVTPVPVRITLNPEMDRVVIVAGDFSVGLTFEDGMIAADQLATALSIMAQ